MIAPRWLAPLALCTLLGCGGEDSAPPPPAPAAARPPSPLPSPTPAPQQRTLADGTVYTLVTGIDGPAIEAGDSPLLEFVMEYPAGSFRTKPMRISFEIGTGQGLALLDQALRGTTKGAIVDMTIPSATISLDGQGEGNTRILARVLSIEKATPQETEN